MKKYQFVNYRGKLIERSELPEYIKGIREFYAKAQRKKTIKKHINLKKLKWYVTITFDPKKKDRFSNNQRALTQLLRRHGLDWYLIAEFHKDGAIHYHGFLSDKPGVFKHFGRDRRGRNSWICEPISKNYGNNWCYPIISQKMINYVVKYATKQGNKALYSRIKLNEFEKKCYELFGDLCKFI